MKKIQLIKQDHKIKLGKECPYIEPNIIQDCLLQVENETIGFYINDVSKYSKKLTQALSIANKEFRSDNVPKTEMMRGPRGTNADVEKRKLQGAERVTQYSTILGSIAPKPVMRRPYPNISSVHSKRKAQTFIKAMLWASIESQKIIEQLTPEIYKAQLNALIDVEEKWKFGQMFTSSISNFNIAAKYHRDTANIVGAVNVILTKRNNANGGCLNVPDYNATFEQKNNSMLVYPAWKNMHGVTPIQKTSNEGYRNSFIFYPLKAFKGI